VISLALLGIAAGAIHTHTFFSKQKEPEDSEKLQSSSWQFITFWVWRFSIFAVLSSVLPFLWTSTTSVSVSGLCTFVAYLVACFLPFFASGCITAGIFRLGSGKISSLYALDLIGAALGCIVAIPWIETVGAPGGITMVACITALISLYLARSFARKLKRIAIVFLLFSILLFALQVSDDGTGFQTVKLGSREQIARPIKIKWNSLARLALLDYFKEDSEGRRLLPFLSWGLSRKYTGWLPKQYLITIDGASETPLTELREDIKKHEYLSYDITSLPYHLRPGAKTLILGAGGGRDILTALWFDSKDVTAVEINKDIVRWVAEVHSDFAGNLYNRPEVSIVVDDARHFVRSSIQKFDVVQFSMIDTFTASSAGAYALTENNLYTVEAFSQYLKRLKPDGLFSVNRFLLNPPRQTLRIVAIAREALAQNGVNNPEACIVVLGLPMKFGSNGLVLVKRSPFDSDELAEIKDIAKNLAFEEIYLPGEEHPNPFESLLESKDPTQFFKGYPLDVRPSTDEWPFFFNTFKLSSFINSLQIRSDLESIRVYNFDAVVSLVILLVFSLVSLIAFVFLPLRKTESPPNKSSLCYFICVGIAYITIEIVLIQKLTLYLGHSVYSLAVVLSALLIFSGIGSSLTSRCSLESLLAKSIVACGVACIFVLSIQELWPLVLNSTLQLARGYRIVIAAALLCPLGIVMGMPYPLALRQVSLRRPNAIPWMWATNGAASVLGSIAAFIVAMTFGFPITLCTGGAFYLFALICAVSWRKHCSTSIE